MLPRGLVLALLWFLPLLAFFTAMPGAASEWQPASMLQSQEMPLLPYMDYYIDESLSLDIEEAAEPSRANAYQPLVLEKLPREEGITWLRFTIAPRLNDTRPETFLLDMGQSIPGEPVLYDPVRNELSGAREWRENTPAQRNILLLPEASSEPVICYIRLDGLPGPWFAPMVRTPQNAAGNWMSLSRTGAILALGVVMLLCLLRGMSENGQWRIWTALYVAVALAQALLGMPTVGASSSFGSLAAIMTPGIALMLLPHVGRHLMRTPANSRALDIQLLFLSLPGCALALWPLIPGWAWLDRWLDLWSAATILFVPTALAAWIGGLGGARRFLVGCLIPPAFTVIAIYGLDFGVPSNFLASLPIWGVAISALLIAATRTPADARATSTRKENRPRKKSRELPAVPEADNVINLEHPLDDPNLRIIGSVETPVQIGIPDSMRKSSPPDLAAAEGPVREDAGLNGREDALRVPLDELLREGAALGQCSLPPAVREYAEKMIAAGNRMASILSGESLAEVGESASGVENVPRVFNLQHILRKVNDSVANMAEQSGTSLSWYMPPHLAQIYRGNGDAIETILKMLAESAVRATNHGAAHISARRAPESSDPGHLLFTIHDNGDGIPPGERSSLALARAWELASAHGGYLAMESGRQGTIITFSMHLAPAEDDENDQTATAPHVVVASEDADMRHHLARMVEGLPCRVSEAANMHEVLVSQSLDPASLLIAHGRLAMPAAADMAHRFAALAAQAGFANCSILAITRDNSQWSLLKPSGFTHAMIEPVDEEDLLQTVAALISPQEAEAKAGPEPDAEAEDTDSENRSQEAVEESSLEDVAEEGVEETQTVPNLFEPEAIGAPNQPLPGALEKARSESLDAFEAPDWLAEEVAAQEEEQVPSMPATAVSMPETPAEASHGNPEPGNMTEQKPAEVERLEMPAESPPDSGTAKSGEDARTAPLTDFIVGVGRPEAAVPEEDFMVEMDTSSADDREVPAVEKEAPEDDGLNDLDPVFRDLLRRLDRAMDSAREAFGDQNGPMVAQYTAQLAADADGFGLRRLARMARCVEGAARKNDLIALNDLLPELDMAVERNRITFTQNGHL